MSELGGCSWIDMMPWNSFSVKVLRYVNINIYSVVPSDRRYCVDVLQFSLAGFKLVIRLVTLSSFINFHLYLTLFVSYFCCLWMFIALLKISRPSSAFSSFSRRCLNVSLSCSLRNSKFVYILISFRNFGFGISHQHILS